MYDQIALVFTLTGGMLLFLLPRDRALAPFFVVSFFMPLGQVVMFAGLHFYMTRLLILFGCARILRERRQRGFSTIDRVMILWVVTSVITWTLRESSIDALVNRLGFAFDALGIYFVVRGLVSDLQDIDRVRKVFALICIFMAVAMLVEYSTGKNAFAAFGGVPMTSEIREGRLRCQGPFLHPIMAGTFGASLVPLFVGAAWGSRRHRALAVLGVVAATVITVVSASSGPLLSYFAAIVGFCVWPFRRSMRAVRWGMLLAAIALHVVMKAPIWALIGRISIVPGSTAYHREALINQFVARFDEWWLLGTRSTSHWGPGFLAMHDVTNQFIAVGVGGGLASLVLFLLLIAFCFRGVGRARQLFAREPAFEKMSWSFGVALFVHVVSFIGVAFFDQLSVLWYAQLALISSLSSLAGSPGTRRAGRVAGAVALSRAHEVGNDPPPDPPAAQGTVRHSLPSASPSDGCVFSP